jgi:malate dehydrogenase
VLVGKRRTLLYSDLHYSGHLLGPEQTLDLYLYDNLENEDACMGLRAELQDCAFPLLNKVVVTSSLDQAFRDSDFNFLVGSKAREPAHLTRKDIVLENSLAYLEIAKAIGHSSKRDCHTLVLGTPPNTNCLICCHHA